MSDAQPRMAFIDTLRLVAAMLVLAQHLFERDQHGFLKTWLIPLAPGVVGVALFFFISGYVIPLSARGCFKPGAFIVRRFFRIYPLYLCTLAAMAVAGGSGLWPNARFIAEAQPGDWLVNILLIADYVRAPVFLTVSWTLAVELVWYAVFAIAVVRYGERAAGRLDMLLPVALVSLTLLSVVSGVRIPMGRPTMIYAAVIGFQCYRYHSGALQRRALAGSLIRFGAVMLIANYVAFGVYSHPNLTTAQAIGPWLIACALFLVAILWRPLRDARMVNAGLLPALGAMSYSIYLLHPLATAMANEYAPSAWRVTVALALTFVVAYLGYHLIERPAIAFGRRVAAKLATPKPVLV